MDWIGPYALFNVHDAATPGDRHFGEKLLERLVNGPSAVDTPIKVLRAYRDDNTLVTAQVIGSQRRIIVDRATAASKRRVEVGQLWIPRGFIVYPAWHSDVFGFGLPIKQDSTYGAYDSHNLAPGLDTSRWTSGGPCGEILVSPDADAGYPGVGFIPAPLLYDDVYGPLPISVEAAVLSDQLAPDPKWKSYRLEFAGFDLFSHANDLGFSQALFEYMNTQRQAAGVPQSWMPFRGYSQLAFDSAVVLAQFNLPQASSMNYPPNYSNIPIRIAKDGYPTDWIAMANTPPANFNRNNIARAMQAGAIGMTANDMFNAWQAASSNALTSKISDSTQLYASRVNAFSIAVFSGRDRWINAGNVWWQSSDKELPPVSWHGFASVNLAFETYPVSFNPDPSTNQTTPLLAASNFTLPNGDCWIQYPRSKTNDTCYYDPAMGRHIYMRGRAIAMAPRGGLVWGACIAKDGDMDRLIALVHHPEDQPSDTLHQGFVRYIRVWWCNIAKRKNGLRMCPPQMICGEATGDPYGWKGGDQFDLGTMPPTGDPARVASDPANSSLKYASAWKFRNDGMRAACLRDYASFVDYYQVSGYILLGSIGPRTVELAFSFGALDPVAGARTLQTTVVNHDFGGIGLPLVSYGTTPPLCNDVTPMSLTGSPAVPFAVDYDTHGALTFVYFSNAYSLNVLTYQTPNVPANESELQSKYAVYSYLGQGPEGITYLSDFKNPMLIGATVGSTNQKTVSDIINILDVNTGTYALGGHTARFVWPTAADPADPGNDLVLVSNYPCQLYTDNLVLNVRLVREGVVVSSDWYSNPDGSMWHTTDLCQPYSVHGGFVSYLPLAASNFVQGYYLERFGQLVYGYQVAPVPNTVWVVAGSTDNPAVCGCLVDLVDVNESPTMSWSAQAPRGGKVISTVPMPDNNWMIYAKVV